MAIFIKRIYDVAEPSDGYRVLVDRLWPRGMRKEDAIVDKWLREIAPSNELRRWYGHDPERFEEFKERYARELDERPEAVRLLMQRVDAQDVTLLTATRVPHISQARALKEYCESREAMLVLEGDDEDLANSEG